jgi:hypothetical protein
VQAGDLGQVVLLILKNRLIDGQGLYRLGRDFLWIIPMGVSVIVLLPGFLLALIGAVRRSGVSLGVVVGVLSFVGFFEFSTSHASLFTGRWPHEHQAGWRSPLDATHLTLAEYLGSRRYDTAGFVANLEYCGGPTGLDRGFVHYEDYPLSAHEIFTRSFEVPDLSAPAFGLRPSSWGDLRVMSGWFLQDKKRLTIRHVKMAIDIY